jgi:hypothetical protein
LVPLVGCSAEIGSSVIREFLKVQKVRSTNKLPNTVVIYLAVDFYKKGGI